jgi:hypothetical protein
VAKHYSIMSFFRVMPAAMLARYFERNGVLQEVEFLSMTTKARQEALFAAWLELPEPERKRMEGEFQDIFSLSVDTAMPALMDEATWQMEGRQERYAAFVEMFSGLSNHYERAMTIFLDYPECWRGAGMLYHADCLPYWCKRKGFPHVPAAVDAASLRALEAMICEYFHRHEGRGRHCHIDCLRRDDRDYFFAYPEDYSRESVEWVEDTLAPRPHNPAFEIVFIWSEPAGTLELNFRGNHTHIEPLQAMFADAILNLPELPEDPKDTRVYDLAPLSQRSFNFTFDTSHGIEDVRVKSLRLSSKTSSESRRGERITVEADPGKNPHAVHDLLAKIGPFLPLHAYHVTRVELTAQVSTKPGEKPRTVTFRITYPNTCSLKYDEVGERLREMLKCSGIEPREATA